MENSELQSHNPWWIRPELILEDGKIQECDAQKYKWIPAPFTQKELETDAVYTLRGPRQVGKTTYLKLLLKQLLLDNNHPKDAVFFYSCDRVEHFNELYDIVESYLRFIRPRTKNRIFILLDEISFVREWQRSIKQLWDKGKLKNATVILTGSNTLDLQYSSERMPGRRGNVSNPDRLILPLTFREYILLVLPQLASLSEEELSHHKLPILEKHFEDYLLTGGFIASINEFHTKEYISPTRYELYSTWIEGDMHRAGKSTETLLRLIEQLEKHSTSSVSYYKLAKETGVSSYSTIEEYLNTLEKMFALVRLHYFDLGQRRLDYKKNHKFYLADPFIHTTLLAKALGFTDDPFNFARRTLLHSKQQPHWSERVIVSLLARLYPQTYYGAFGGREIDIVARSKGVYTFFEVKHQNNVTIEDFSWTRQWLAKNEHLYVITKKDFAHKGNIHLLPRTVFLVEEHF